MTSSSRKALQTSLALHLDLVRLRTKWIYWRDELIIETPVERKRERWEIKVSSRACEESQSIYHSLLSLLAHRHLCDRFFCLNDNTDTFILANVN